MLQKSVDRTDDHQSIGLVTCGTVKMNGITLFLLCMFGLFAVVVSDNNSVKNDGVLQDAENTTKTDNVQPKENCSTTIDEDRNKRSSYEDVANEPGNYNQGSYDLVSNHRGPGEVLGTVVVATDQEERTADQQQGTRAQIAYNQAAYNHPAYTPGVYDQGTTDQKSYALGYYQGTTVGESVQEGFQKIQSETVVKEVGEPYPFVVEKPIPYQVKVPIPVDKPYPVSVPKPYAVPVEKPVPYEVKVNVPQPYTVYKPVPYEVKVPVDKPYAVNVPVPYIVYLEKSVPYTVTKHVPYAVHVAVNRPYTVQVPVEKRVPYVVPKPVPYTVKVPVDRPYTVTVEKHVPYTVEKPVPYIVQKPVPYPVKVPVKIEVPVPYTTTDTQTEKPFSYHLVDGSDGDLIKAPSTYEVSTPSEELQDDTPWTILKKKR